jgi:starvation-inducible DNA-binding protein
MKAVPRSAIVDHDAYERMRPEFRTVVMAAKAPRRIHVGDHVTFLFENALTTRYQVLEMVRTERMTREADILHELETYNALLGGPGELSATMLVEIDDPAVRDVRLREWYALPEHVYAMLDDGTRVRPAFDASQRGRGRLSSVQYLRFPVGGRVPVALGMDLPGAACESRLTAEQRAALAEDLADEGEGASPGASRASQERRRDTTMTPNIGIADEHRRSVAAILNALLADEYVLYTKTRNYHWNVVGPRFNDLHAFFQKQYEALDDVVDDVAERIRALGVPTAATLAEFSKLTRLREHPGQYPDADGMLAALLADHEAVIRQLRVDVDACTEHKDVGTSDFLTGLMEQHEKTAWMLRSFSPAAQPRA